MHKAILPSIDRGLNALARLNRKKYRKIEKKLEKISSETLREVKYEGKKRGIPPKMLVKMLEE